MHLADAFIQLDLQCIQVIHCVFPGNRTHNLCTDLPLSHRNSGIYSNQDDIYSVIQIKWLSFPVFSAIVSQIHTEGWTWIWQMKWIIVCDWKRAQFTHSFMHFYCLVIETEKRSPFTYSRHHPNTHTRTHARTHTHTHTHAHTHTHTCFSIMMGTFHQLLSLLPKTNPHTNLSGLYMFTKTICFNIHLA